MAKAFLANRAPGFLTRLVGALLLCVSMAASAGEGLSLSKYPLGPGDLIKITVFGEEDMSVETRLTDAGTISYPFLGEIRVRGLTVGALEKSLTRQLKGDYLINPRVNITIAEYRKFYVHGEVKQPGGFSFEPGLTLDKAIALAGGFSERADRKKVDIRRERADGSKEKIKADLSASVRPGDIIRVQESFF